MSIQATLAIFQELASAVPPLVSPDIQKDIERSYDQASGNLHLTIEELEDIVVSFGKKLWPYREAFLEFYRQSESTVGEKFFTAKLSSELRSAYRAYQQQRGTFRDLYLGKDLRVFTSDQRQELCEILVAVTHELWDYTVQRVLGVDRQRYEDRINEFRDVQKEMDHEMAALRHMAEEEGEHPELAAEIREHIRGFEHGMALLGPKLDSNSVCQSVEHFYGRRAEKKRLRQL